MAGITPYTHESWRKTNADRFRCMTDEELAGWLVDNMDCFNCRVKHTCQIMNGDCLAAWLVWLKEEAKDEHT